MIFVCILIVILFVSLMALCIFYFDLRDDRLTCEVLIKFSDFLGWYSIASNEWELSDKTVRKNCSKYGEKVWCYFSLCDTIRYMFWHEELKGKQQDIRDRETYIKLYESIERDIKKLKDQANEEIEQANLMMKSLAK